MFGKSKKDTESDINEQARSKIKAVFQQMKNDVLILLFTIPGKNEKVCDSAREVISAFSKFTPKIRLSEFTADHKEAIKWKIKYSPTIIFDPEHYNIRWYGAPTGEETRTFVELVMMMGHVKSRAGAESQKILDRITSPRHIKLFVSPT